MRRSYEGTAGGGIYKQEMSIRGAQPPAWFRDNRDHVYSSASEFESVQKNEVWTGVHELEHQQSRLEEDSEEGRVTTRRLDTSFSPDERLLSIANLNQTKTTINLQPRQIPKTRERGRNGINEQLGYPLNVEDSIVSRNSSPSTRLPRRLSSVGKAPTKGEFAIMQKLGENNYYVMKKLRGSQPLKANKSQTGTNFLLYPKTANSSSIKFSRPVTSTTKPTIKVRSNNRSSLATFNKFRETNIN